MELAPCPDCGGAKANRYAARCRGCATNLRSRPACSLDGCSRPHVAHGFCGLHRGRVLRGKALGDPIRGQGPYRRGQTQCPVDGCERLTFAPFTGLCSMHWERMRDKGELGPANSLKRPAGTWSDWRVDRFGYVRRRRDGKWQTQHRMVVEQLLGRALLPDENIHHMNGDRQDNRPENLELWSKAQPAGQRVADKVAWAIELLKLYAPERLADGYSG